MQNDDIFWMTKALKLAHDAKLMNEVPVGAIVVYNNEILGTGFNCSIQNHDPCAHAEIIALRKAAATIQNYRLINTTLYVTLEPCVMCFGAMLHARIKRLVFGASDPKTGVIKSWINLPNYNWNHTIDYSGGVLSNECSKILQDFFKLRR